MLTSASVDHAPMHSSNISTAAAVSAQDSQGWIERLQGSGADRDAALVELHALLLRAARFEVNDIAATARYLRGQGVPVEERNGRIRVGPDAAEGAILEFVAASARAGR